VASHQKILVIRFGALGDVVLATPALAALRSAFPKADIHFLAKAEYSDLLAGLPSVDKALALGGRGFRALWGMARELRHSGYDLVVDLHGNFRSRLVSLLSGAKVLRARKYSLRRRTEVWFKIRPARPLPSVGQRYLDCLTPVLGSGRPAPKPGPGLRPAPGDLRWARLFLKRHGLAGHKNLAALAPGATWATKRWKSSNFASAALALSKEKGLRWVILGGDRDAPACREVAEAMANSGREVVQAAGLTTVGQCLALLSLCRVLISNDSGAMHLAGGLGLPVVALFGPTVRDFGFMPSGPTAAVLEADLECRPCSLHGTDRCPLGTHACMEKLAPSMVVASARRLLEA
jgi:heptosyltransferase-2